MKKYLPNHEVKISRVKISSSSPCSFEKDSAWQVVRSLVDSEASILADKINRANNLLNEMHLVITFKLIIDPSWIKGRKERKLPVAW